MTDYDKVKALFDELGIPYTDESDDDYKKLTLEPDPGPDDETHKVRGYVSFYCIWVFKPNGSFDSVGIWE